MMLTQLTPCLQRDPRFVMIKGCNKCTILNKSMVFRGEFRFNELIQSFQETEVEMSKLLDGSHLHSSVRSFP